MSRSFLGGKATVLTLGLLACAPLAAQTTTSSTATTQDSSGLVLRDGKALIGATLSTTGGRYGTITDMVYDGTGAVEYALVERQGQLHPVPFSLLQFGATGDATVNASSATLDTVTVDRNNLRPLSDSTFGSQLRVAFGPSAVSASGSVGTSSTTGTTSGTGTTSSTNSNASTTAARNRVFSLAGLLGGTINAQNGEAGSISTIAINPNGTFAYAVGVNSTGDTRFAVPFAVAQLNSQANGISVAAPVSTLTSIAVPQGSLPTSADQAFFAALTTAFGNQASSFAIGGSNPPLSTAQMNLLARNDQFNNDPVVQAGNSSQSGVNAIAGAGDSRRGGLDAVARPGDRASTNGTGGLATTGAMPSNARPGSNSASAVPTTASTQANVANPSSFGTGSGTGGIVNLAESAPTTQTSGISNSGLIQMRDLLNFRIQAQDGAFGRVADIVFDRNGNIQYMLGSYQGNTYPLPFSPSMFSGASGTGTANNTLTFNVPISSLQQLAINPQSLPTLQNQAFTQRMQQVFGSAFASSANQNVSGYSPSGTSGTGTTSGTGSTSGTGTTSSGTANASGSTSGTRSSIKLPPGSAGTSTTDTWTWPTSPMPGYGPKLPPGFKGPLPNPYTMGRTGTGTGTGTRTGTGTGTNSGVRSNSGNTNNSGVGTGGRGINPPPNGRTRGANGTSGSGTNNSGTTGSGTSGSGTSGTGSSGTGGSGSSGGSSSSGSGS